MKKTFSRALSVLLAVVMLAVSVPVAFAAEPIALSESNVTVWPTASGEIYFGQKISDGITLSGGEVQYNGAVVPGKFDFNDINYMPTSAGNQIASIKFVPSDTQSYNGFEVQMAWDVTYKVNKTTPVLVNETDLPVATEVEAGAALSTSTLSGGQVKNPYNESESKALAAKWRWTKTSTIVNESGYYQARMVIGTTYEVIYQDVYVKVAGDVPNSAIETMPTINVTYIPDLTWGEVAIEGGKAVIKDTTTEVEGSFTVTDKWMNTAVKVGTTEIDVKFTPTDETVALPYEFKCPVTVNKAVPAFKSDDESGIPTITMPYGTKLDSSLDHKIKPLIDVNVPVSLAYKDLEGNDLSYSGTTPVVGTHEIQVRVNIDNTNYEQFTMLTFNLEITGFTANCIMVPVGTEGYKIIDESLAYNAAKPTGTFTVSYTINGEKQTDKTVKYGELFQVEKTKSGKYEFSIKYNKTENDPFEIADITYTGTVVLSHNVTINGQKQTADYNTTVTASAPATDPAQPDKPYYGFTNWEAKGIDISEEQAASPEFSFTMPDEDVELKANYKFSIKLFFEWILARITQFFTFIVNAVKDLIALA